MENNKPLLVTHDSTFHADDVFAMATLAIFLNDKYEIIRTRDEEKIKIADYVCDVGGEYNPAGNRFDHHQIGGAGVRENGIPYASFGLVWKKYGENICGSREVAEIIDKKLVQPIDANDNGVESYTAIPPIGPYIIQSFLYAYRPTWNEKEDYDRAFQKVVGIAKELLEREITVAKNNEEGINKLFEIYENTVDKKLLVLDQKLPWEFSLIEKPDVLIVIAPRPDGRWKAEATFVTTNSLERKISFPESWAGLRDEELQKVTGVSDAVFCHRGRFMCVAQSKIGAQTLAELALSQK